MFNLKQTLLCFLLIGIAMYFLMPLVACNGKSKPILKLGDRQVVAVYEDSLGNRFFDKLLQRVVDTIQRDTMGTSQIVRVEVWGYPIYDSLRDKQTGKPVLDSVTQKYTVQVVSYMEIPRKRIILDIANKDFDSLMKKRLK